MSVAIFRDGKVLLAARGKAPMLGLYSLPGGMVEPGETLEAAALREVMEEVGLHVELAGFVDIVEIIRRDPANAVERHVVICAFAARWTTGEPSLSEEASAIVWADPDTLDGLPVTDRLHEIVAKAKRQIV